MSRISREGTKLGLSGIYRENEDAPKAIWSFAFKTSNGCSKAEHSLAILKFLQQINANFTIPGLVLQCCLSSPLPNFVIKASFDWLDPNSIGPSWVTIVIMISKECSQAETTIDCTSHPSKLGFKILTLHTAFPGTETLMILDVDVFSSIAESF